MLRAGADEHNRGAEVLFGDVYAVVMQAEFFSRGGWGEGLCHDVDT